MDLGKCMEELDKLKDNFTPEEICWLIRNISYYLISYFGESSKGVIYDGSFNETQIWQATKCQNRISVFTDLLSQILKGREFDKEYFEDKLQDR